MAINMNLSGIRPGAGFYEYNTKKSDTAVKEQPEEIKTAAASVVEEGRQSNSPEVASQEVSGDRTDNGAREFAERYQPEALYEHRGGMSDIASLDVEQAISDMKRDQVLQQYQFFVGESQAEELLAAARERENFYL